MPEPWHECPQRCLPGSSAQCCRRISLRTSGSAWQQFGRPRRRSRFSHPQSRSWNGLGACYRSCSSRASGARTCMERCRLLMAYSKARTIAGRRCRQTEPRIWNIFPTHDALSGRVWCPDDRDAEDGCPSPATGYVNFRCKVHIAGSRAALGALPGQHVQPCGPPRNLIVWELLHQKFPYHDSTLLEPPTGRAALGLPGGPGASPRPGGGTHHVAIRAACRGDRGPGVAGQRPHERLPTGPVGQGVKGVRKTYHCGGRIVYHRRDDRGPYGRLIGDRLGDREQCRCELSVSGSSRTWDAALSLLRLRR